VETDTNATPASATAWPRPGKSFERYWIGAEIAVVGVVGLQPQDFANGILHSYTTHEEVVDDLIIRQLV